MWCGMVETFPLLNRWLAWSVGYGFQVRIGYDLVAGMEQFCSFSPDTLKALHSKRLYFLNHIRKSNSVDLTDYWLSSADIGLRVPEVTEWDNYIAALRHPGILLQDSLDNIGWMWNSSSGVVTTGLAYRAIAFIK